MKAVHKALIFIIVIILGQLVVSACSSSAPEQQIRQEPSPSSIEREEKEETKLEKEELTLTISQVNEQLISSSFLDSAHITNEVGCNDCHYNLEEGKPVTLPEDQTCLDCHGSYNDLADFLKDKEQWKNYNPHFAHERDDCITCHKAHQPFELTCSSCHSVRAPERFR